MPCSRWPAALTHLQSETMQHLHGIPAVLIFRPNTVCNSSIALYVPKGFAIVRELLRLT